MVCVDPGNPCKISDHPWGIYHLCRIQCNIFIQTHHGKKANCMSVCVRERERYNVVHGYFTVNFSNYIYRRGRRGRRGVVWLVWFGAREKVQAQCNCEWGISGKVLWWNTDTAGNIWCHWVGILCINGCVKIHLCPLFSLVHSSKDVKWI